MREKPRRADEHMKFLRGNSTRAPKGSVCYRPEGPLDATLIAALTGTDFRCLEAIDRLWAAHSFADHPDRIIRAIALIALEMQESTRVLAREVIPHAKDWGDRARLWPLVEREMWALMSLREKAESGMFEPGRRVSVEMADGKIVSMKPENDS